jgi:CRISPR-associated endonuclease Cas2
VSKSKEFISKFIKFVSVATIEGGYVMSELFNSLGSISYKGVRYTQSPYYRGVYNLKRRGFIEVKNNRFFITPMGKKWLKSSYLKYAKTINPKWDKKWRIVMFDIPRERHNNRNLFRSRLKSLGFVNVQKSIFVFPYPCEQDIAELCKRYKILDYVDVITADSIGSKQEEVEKHFSL